MSVKPSKPNAATSACTRESIPTRMTAHFLKITEGMSHVDYGEALYCTIEEFGVLKEDWVRRDNERLRGEQRGTDDK